MTTIKNLIVAFSLYSKIPMPIFEWKEKDMKHNLVFLPVVGLVIGVLVYFADCLMVKLNAPLIFQLAILSLLPIAVTGGFHIDGFMDVRDALSSYADKEKKLEILKDPHIGAFAVIHLAMLSLVWLGSLSLKTTDTGLPIVTVYSLSFFIVRAVCGALSLMLKKAKKDGMLNMETKAATKADAFILLVEALIGVGAIFFLSVPAGAIVVFDIIAFSLYYKHMAYKNFGGVTGDLSGFGIVTLEVLILFSLALAGLFI